MIYLRLFWEFFKTGLFSVGSQHSCSLSAHVGPVSHYCDHILFLFDGGCLKSIFDPLLFEYLSEIDFKYSILKNE